MAKTTTVEFLEAIAVANGGYDIGSVHKVPVKQANQWIKNGWCRKVTDKNTTVSPDFGNIVQAPAPIPEEPAEDSDKE